MKAIMLAAGVGSRLFGDDGGQPPKSLLEFGGMTLLQRNIEVLKTNGVDELVMVVGYRKDEIMAEAIKHGDGFVRFIDNPDFRRGPVISLWLAREVLRGGDDVLFMDADVLYHPDLLGRLIASAHGNCFVFDHGVDHCIEAVKLCIRDGAPVEFGKGVEGDFDQVGEWPGFLKYSPPMAAKLAVALQTYIDADDLDSPYEPAMRDVLLSEPPGTFGVEDITGLPWIEIDFPEDMDHAKDQVLPRINGAKILSP
ncbi:MAG TPA: phosphocholine cytidylyltransferase family protein [Rhodospirillales bacterium]|nr:phosphocholine cytidylyltransferase family protein [Rhodospirillales bacterium]